MADPLASLKRHNKCLRTKTKSIVSLAMRGAKNKTSAKRAEVARAAALVARAVCSKKVQARVVRAPSKRKKSTGTKRAKSAPPSTFSPPDFSRNLLTRAPEPERSPYWAPYWG